LVPTWINRQGSALAAWEELAVISDSLQIADRARRIGSKTIDADARQPRFDRLYLAIVGVGASSVLESCRAEYFS
jgi:hypothetical protein